VGIVKISEELHQEIRQASGVMSRSINAQAEFWIKLGALAELNPELTYNEIVKKVLMTELHSIKDLVDE
jgi:hypothetical protein